MAKLGFEALGKSLGDYFRASAEAEKAEEFEMEKKAQKEEKEKLIKRLEEEGHSLEAQYIRAGGKLSSTTLDKIRESNKAKTPSDKFGKKYEQYSAYQSMSKQMNNELLQGQEAVMAAMQSGDKKTITDAQTKYNLVVDAWESKMKPALFAVDSMYRQYGISEKSEALDQTLSKLDPDKMAMLSKAFDQKLSSEIGSDLYNKLDQAEQVNEVPLDLSGIPSDEALHKLVMSSIFKGQVTQDRAQIIMSMDNENLIGLIKDETSPDIDKAIAATVYKRRRATRLLKIEEATVSALETIPEGIQIPFAAGQGPEQTTQAQEMRRTPSVSSESSIEAEISRIESKIKSIREEKLASRKKREAKKVGKIIDATIESIKTEFPEKDLRGGKNLREEAKRKKLERLKKQLEQMGS